MLLQALVRSVVHEPALAAGRSRAAAALREDTAVVLVGAALLAAGALALQPLAGTAVSVAFAVGAPVLLLHDGRRFRALAEGRMRALVALDLLWAVPVCAVALAPGADAGRVAAAYAVGPLLAVAAPVAVALPSSARAAVRARVRASSERLGRQLLADQLLFLALTQASTLLLVVAGGAAEAGRLRLAYSVMSPVATLLTGVGTAVLAGAARGRRAAPPLVGLLAVVIAVVGVTAAAAPALGLLGVPDDAVPDTTTVAALGVTNVLIALCLEPLARAKVAGDFTRPLRARVVGTAAGAALFALPAVRSTAGGTALALVVPQAVIAAAVARRRPAA